MGKVRGTGVLLGRCYLEVVVSMIEKKCGVGVNETYLSG